jgi:hypothetical protein
MAADSPVRIEHIKKTERKKAEIQKKGKQRTKEIVSHLSPLDKSDDNPDSQWRTDVLFGRKRKRGDLESKEQDTGSPEDFGENHSQVHEAKETEKVNHDAG